MCAVQSATSNTTTGVLAARLTTNELDYWKLLRDILGGVGQAIAVVWQASRIGDFLLFILSIFLFIFKWYIIVVVIVISIRIIGRVGYWGLPQLWKIYRESRRRQFEEQWRNDEIKRRAARLAELRAKKVVDAATLEAAKLQQARREQDIKDKLQREEVIRQTKLKADYKRWEMECDIAFRDKASMTKFPFPPLPRCTDPNCSAFTKLPVPACQHNVKQFFKGSGVFSMEFLKLEKSRWHEDRFASCQEYLRPEFRSRANSLFIVLHPWYEELKEQQRSAVS
ncbi:hypothetical protein V490_00860 [Pseudogymnoascus sp. VKM F-3557]|nr:hypothetical protein V490_00860 [Pseudogymnoascus sp. VKM F-3557]